MLIGILCIGGLFAIGYAIGYFVEAYRGKQPQTKPKGMADEVTKRAMEKIKNRGHINNFYKN